MKNLLSSILAAFIFLSSIANAKEENKDYQLFDIDFFSLSKKKEDAFDAPSSIYVLSAEDIRRSGLTSIPEILRLVPGLQVARIDGHKWAISSRGFNAQFSNKLLVMIDGRTVYTPLFSGTFWDNQDYILEDIEKIEVIRGSGGAIWGANAVNGIINIITKNAVDTQGGYFSQIVGDEDKSITEVRYGSRTKERNHYRLYAKQVHRNSLEKQGTNIDNEDGYRQTQAGFRYDIRSIKDNTISIHADIRDGHSENYFDFNSVPSLAIESPYPTNKKSKGGNLVVKWDKTISRKSSISLQSFIDYDQFDTYVLKRDGRTYDIDFQHFYDISDRNQLVWGLGYRFIKDDIDENSVSNSFGDNFLTFDYDPNERNDSIYNAFLQDKISLIDDKLYLILGSKFEHNDYTGFEYQPSAKINYFPSRNQTLWASVSRAVRTPTRGEDDIEIKGHPNVILNRGSNQYDAEKVIAYELGYRIKPNRKTLVDISAFYNNYEDLRTFECVGGNPSTCQGSAPTAANFGEGYSFGAEVTAKWQATDSLRLELGYDFLQVDLRKLPFSEANGSAENIISFEGRSPKNQLRLRSHYNVTPKLEFDTALYYVDSLAPTEKEPEGIPSYIRLDTRIGYLVNPSLDFSIGLQNLTDRRHQEFKNGTFSNQTDVGRTAYFKATVLF